MSVKSKRSESLDSEEEEEVGEMASMVNGHTSNEQVGFVTCEWFVVMFLVVKCLCIFKSTWNDEEDWTNDWEKRNDDEEGEMAAEKPTTADTQPHRQQNGIPPVVTMPRKKHQGALFSNLMCDCAKYSVHFSFTVELFSGRIRNTRGEAGRGGLFRRYASRDQNEWNHHRSTYQGEGEQGAAPACIHNQTYVLLYVFDRAASKSDISSSVCEVRYG